MSNTDGAEVLNMFMFLFALPPCPAVAPQRLLEYALIFLDDIKELDLVSNYHYTTMVCLG